MYDKTHYNKKIKTKMWCQLFSIILTSGIKAEDVMIMRNAPEPTWEHGKGLMLSESGNVPSATDNS